MPLRVPFLTMTPGLLIFAVLLWTAPGGASGDFETAAAALARATAQQAVPAGRPPLLLDPSLGRAARRHLDEVIADPKKARLDRVQAALAAEGLADAQVLPFTTLGADPEGLARALADFARTTARPRGMTHLGVAAVQQGPKLGLAALFSRRLVELAPLARTPDRGALTVRGRSRASVRIEALLLTGGSVVRLSVKPDKEGVFAVPLRFLDHGPGPDVLEIVAESERGPEISALWRFDIPWRAASRPADSGTDPPIGHGPEGARMLIDRIRTAHDVAPLEPDPALEEAARRYAQAVCLTMIAAHVASDGSTPVDRARHAGYRGAVTENIAIASSIALAHQNLMESPSHRLNLIDPAAKVVGVGVAERDGSYCVVEMFGRD